MPVVDREGKVAGILTDEDLLERAGIHERLSVAVRMEPGEINLQLGTLENSPLKVAAVMTRPVITVREDESLGAVTARMVKAGLKRLPVVDGQEKLVGVLSRLDILHLVANTPQEDLPPHAPLGAVRTVGEIMAPVVPTVSQNDSLAVLVERFAQTNSHRLIVVDDFGKAIGLISDADVVARIQPGRRSGIIAALRRIGKTPSGKETAYDLMSHGPLSAPPDLPVVEAIRRMMAEARKWMVVVDGNGCPLGLVDRQILLEALANQRPGPQGEWVG
jgi:CBS-domain-containing membrane protein